MQAWILWCDSWEKKGAWPDIRVPWLVDDFDRITRAGIIHRFHRYTCSPASNNEQEVPWQVGPITCHVWEQRADTHYKDQHQHQNQDQDQGQNQNQDLDQHQEQDQDQNQDKDPNLDKDQHQHQNQHQGQNQNLDQNLDRDQNQDQTQNRD